MQKSEEQLPSSVNGYHPRRMRMHNYFTCLTNCLQGAQGQQWCDLQHLTQHGVTRHYTVVAHLPSISAQPSTQDAGSERSPKSSTRMCSLTSFTGFMTSSPAELHINTVITDVIGPTGPQPKLDRYTGSHLT